MKKTQPVSALIAIGMVLLGLCLAVMSVFCFLGLLLGIEGIAQ